MFMTRKVPTLPAGMRHIFLDDDSAFPGIAIETPVCRALVALQGAQLLTMQPAGQGPLLWLSPGAQFRPGKAVRGGIPLCFPWFAAHAENPAMPAHGFARNREWQLCEASADAAGNVHLAFALRDDEQTRALWPHAFLARLDYRLGAALAVAFSVTNTGSQALAFGFALHNYFPLRDVSRSRLTGLEGVSFHDKIFAGSGAQIENIPLRIDRETDRVYHDASGEYHLTDDVSGRALAIRAEGCRSAVVWNPWREKAARLGDVPGDAWKEMLCVECGNVGAADVRLLAGETRVFRQTVSVA
jgi:glucose-6-phosphate 1-epimerase